MSQAPKGNTCLDSLLPLDSGIPAMFVLGLGWTTILICPGLRCSLGVGHSVLTLGLSRQTEMLSLCLVRCAALWDQLMNSQPLLLHQGHQLMSPTLLVLHTRILPQRKDAICIFWKNEERLTCPGFSELVCTWPGKRTSLRIRRLTQLLSGCVNFCQVIHWLLLNFLVYKEGQGVEVSTVPSLLHILGFYCIGTNEVIPPCPDSFHFDATGWSLLGGLSLNAVQKMEPSSRSDMGQSLKVLAWG